MPARPRIVSGRLISFKAPTKNRRHYSMPQPRRHRRGPKPDRRRALELLAASRDGCTEAMLRAHGFSTAQMVDLVRARLATAHSQRVIVGGGGRRIEAARVKITEAGRQALAGTRWAVQGEGKQPPPRAGR